MNPTMTNTQAQQLTPWQVYLTLSESATEAYNKADRKKPCSSEWWEQVGRGKAYREAAILMLESITKQC